MVQNDNAVTALTAAVTRLGEYDWPVEVTTTVQRFLNELAAAGIELDLHDPQGSVHQLGSFARMFGATIRNVTNPTMLNAGYKVNVVPGEAEAHVDGRFLPGHQEEFFAKVDELIGDKVTRELVVHDKALETEFAGGLVDAMRSCLSAEDPAAQAVPYLMSGGTDAKAWSRLGIKCFGFSPLQLPPDLDFMAMFHGIDERVPVTALEFGCRVLDRFLDEA
jgi:acetylornithine deacetylase/succinyl-diaminopimelate desuccinylase-like protein